MSLLKDWENTQLGHDPRWAESQKVSISICGSGTLQYLQPHILRAALADGLIPQVNIGAYNQWFQELATQDEKVINSHIDVLWLFCDLESLLPVKMFSDFSSLLSRNGLEETYAAIENLMGLLAEIRKTFKGFILINEFFSTRRSPFGIGDCQRDVSYSEYYANANNKLQKEIKGLPYSGIFPMSGLLSRYGSDRAIDSRLKLLADCPFTEEFFLEISEEIRPYLRAIKASVRKVLVLDLDNTVWGGVVGEDGWNGVKIGNDPIGKAFLEFQKAILELYNRGTVLAINSKNNFEDIKEVFQNRSEMILKLEHFASVKANWNDKATNCNEIAKEINVGLDSLVFWDDNPAERMLVGDAIEEVYVANPPEDISSWASFLHNLSLFDSMNIAEEDMVRGKMYAENRQRNEAEKSSSNLTMFYHSLGLKVTCHRGNEGNLPRIVALLGRTNQFNLTTKRYTESEIRSFIEDENWEVRCYSAEDRFGRYGIVGVGLTKYEDGEASLDSFLLSCRAMGKGIEHAMMADVAACVADKGIRRLNALYRPTKKNVPIQIFLPEIGFHSKNGSDMQKTFSIQLDEQKLNNPEYIELINVK